VQATAWSGSGGGTVRGRRSGAGVRAVVRVRAGGGATARWHGDGAGLRGGGRRRRSCSVGSARARLGARCKAAASRLCTSGQAVRAADGG
jgi:hypothetical protein